MVDRLKRFWPLWALLGAWATMTLVLRLVAAPPDDLLTETRVTAIPGVAETPTLVVLVHGFGASYDRLDPLRQLVEAEPSFAGADLLVPRYPSGIFTNSSVFGIASQLEETIDELHRSNRYQRILLVGHSMGAQLVRKAFVWGHGQTRDRPPTFAETSAKEWVEHVERIVLLAGVNRGWSLTERPENMSVGRYAVQRLGMAIAGLTGTGRMIMGTHRGEPFVADLRVQWLNVTARLGDDTPIVAQLLGDEDDVVSPEDNRDVAVTRHYHFLPVSNTGHLTVLDLGSSGDTVSDNERQRRDALRLALTGSSVALEAEGSPQATLRDPTVSHVVFVMHGIRDDGQWVEALAEAIEHHADGHPEVVHVETSKYGNFPMAPFIVGWTRRRNVRWFMDRYTEVRATYPNAVVSFVGHSNGTYLAAAAMTFYEEIDFERLVFAGSVVPSDFGWDELERAERFVAIRNYVGSRDWIVGTFPGFFELMRRQLVSIGNRDIGAAGFVGFLESAGNRDQFHVPAGHGTVVSRDGDTWPYFDEIADYVLDGEDQAAHARAEQATIPKWMWRLSPFIWVGLIFVVFWAGRKSMWVAERLAERWNKSFSPRWGVAVYVGFLVVLLNVV